MRSLAKSNIVFNEEAHTYTLSFVGVTSILTRQLFAKKYDNIPDRVLQAAADRGTTIHNICELIDTLGIEPTTDEGLKYCELKQRYTINPIANEYLVTDGKYVASKIDIVAEMNDRIDLIDIKTTSKLDKEYVSWQLSIYAYLFELMNPTKKIEKLAAIWLPKLNLAKKADVIEVERKPVEWVKELIAYDERGEQYQIPAK